jgi:pimeloyl-ACP methyl ester carboxylesterase
MMTTHAHGSGLVKRDGVRLHYEVHGTGEPTILLLPGWIVADSRLWFAQTSALSRRHKVISYDARGSGRSDRPTAPDAYEFAEHVADALAVLDATGTERAVLIGNSMGGIIGYLMAAAHPDRALAVVLVDATLNLLADRDAPFVRALLSFNDDRAADEPFARYNRSAMTRDYPGFVRWFISTAVPEPHATAARALGLQMGLNNTAEVLAASLQTRAAVPPEVQAGTLRGMAGAIRCPVLVVHGVHDEIVPIRWGRELARMLRARIVEFARAGHCPFVSYPERFNRLVLEFVNEHVPVRAG